ncbi:MAG: hypothetical protein WBD32_08730 [Acidobacteriaceae bacterium]
MIESYNINFGPVVSRKELETAIHEGALENADIHKMKARIEIVADFEDLKRIAALLKESARK